MKYRTTSTVHCTDAAKYICENLDEDTNSAKCRTIKKHLQSCTDCSRQLKDLKALIAFYKKTSTPRLALDAKKKILAAVLHS